MASFGDLIDFEVIENQKENIQSLPGGRSARGLANLFSPSPLHKLSTPTPTDTQNLNETIRQEFEAELVNIAESDDPLDIYERYVRWTLDAYPSAQATPTSQLLPLLERATKAFLTSSQYNNDPRYLKLWLSYIRFFSDTPRETFAFLARHNIGETLALFYEEFAAWLEGAGRWSQAEEIYKMGIGKQALPVQRLLRRYKEFEERAAQRSQNIDEPSSPILPSVRPALAAKIDPFAAAASRDPQASPPRAGVGGAAAKPGRQKLKIFADGDDESPAMATGIEGPKGWQNIASLAERKKENTMEPKPWVGEVLKAGGKKSGSKLAVFKDESLSSILFPNPPIEQMSINARNGRSERIFVNLEAVYPTPDELGTELSFEELRAAHRGWSGKVWESELMSTASTARPMSRDQTRQSSVSIEISRRDVSEKLSLARDPVLLDENGQVKEHSREGKPRKMKIKEVNETQIIKAKLSSPSGRKMTKRKPSKEATMTIHTKAATDEIYDLFSQPLKKNGSSDDEESSGDDDDDDMTDGDYTSGGESTGTGRLMTASEAGDEETSEVKSVSEWSEFTARKHVPKVNEDEDASTRASRTTDNDDNTRASTITDAEDEDFEQIQVDIPHDVDEGDMGSPNSPVLPSMTKTTFVPIPPEDYVAPMKPYRDPLQISQNRLPFMTPIAEKTESSFGVLTIREDKGALLSKTPSKSAGGQKDLPGLDELGSSPFREIIDEKAPAGRMQQPKLTNSMKTNKSASTVTTVRTVKEAVFKEPIIKDAQCNPVDEYVRSLIFEGLPVPLSSFEGFFGHGDERYNRAVEIRRFSKAFAKISKSTNDKTVTNLAMPPLLTFPEADREYLIKRELGAGAFAPVYLIEGQQESDVEEDGVLSRAVMGKGAFDHYGRKPLEALKMEDPPSAWEFYIMRQAKRRLGVSRAAASIVDVYELHLYQDECYLIEEYRDQGTLLDLINVARAESAGTMDELLVMFFSIELFRTIEVLHSKSLLHGDLKADNCLVRLDSLSDTDVWSTRYRKDGTGGWDKKGLALIDFGRGIDLKVFRPDVQFIADWKTGPQDCAEMRELRPWTHQIDYHGLAGIIHSMLFGKYIETLADKGQGLGEGLRRWRIRESLKRYWQTEVWGGVFDLLLNPMAHLDGEEGSKMPVLKGMKAIRAQMEDWLEANSERGMGLQALIRKLEYTIHARRK